MEVNMGFELEHQLSWIQGLVLEQFAKGTGWWRFHIFGGGWTRQATAGPAPKRIKHSLWKQIRLHTPKTLVSELCRAGSDERDTLGGGSAECLVTVWEQGIRTGHHPV